MTATCKRMTDQSNNTVNGQGDVALPTVSVSPPPPFRGTGSDVVDELKMFKTIL